MTAGMFGLQHVIEGVRDYRHVRPASVNVIEGDVRERCSAPCKYFDLLKLDISLCSVFFICAIHNVHILVWALSFWAPCPTPYVSACAAPALPSVSGSLCSDAPFWVLSFGSLGYLHCLCIDR